MNAMTASVIAATLTTPDDITRPSDAFAGDAHEGTEADAPNKLFEAGASGGGRPTGSADDVDYLANKLTPNDARVLVDLLKLAVAGRVSAAAQSILSASLAAIGEKPRCRDVERALHSNDSFGLD